MSLFEVACVLWFFVPAYAADVSPIFAARLFPRLDAPLDGGRTLAGKTLLGAHKTWRGLLACVLAGTATGPVQAALESAGPLGALALPGCDADPWLRGALLGFGAGIGDAARSFFKRRWGVAPGEPWIPFDQLDFVLGAALFVSVVCPLPPVALLLSLPVVFVCDVAATAAFWLVGLKERWI